MLALIQAAPAPWYQDPITVATWVIAISTVLYFCTSLGLLLLTKQMFEASHRPFIGSSDVKMAKNAGPPPFIEFRIPVHNFGTIPAHDFSVNVQIIADGVLIPTDIAEEETIAVVMPGPPYTIYIKEDNPYHIEKIETAGDLSVVFKCSYKGLKPKSYTYETKFKCDRHDNHFHIVKAKTS